MASSLSTSNFGKNPLTLSVGEWAKQANGSVSVSYGDTVVLSTACMRKDPAPEKGFFPLTVEYQERTYAMGKWENSHYLIKQCSPICHDQLA